MKPDIRAIREVLGRHGAAIITTKGTSSAREAVERELAALAAPQHGEALEIKQLLRDLLEYIDWLEVNGGYSMSGGGSKAPLTRAQEYLDEELDGSSGYLYIGHDPNGQ